VELIFHGLSRLLCWIS